MYWTLINYIKGLEEQESRISEDRRGKLRQIAAFIRDNVGSGKKAKLTFICTHNSRRSQFCQIWLEVLGYYLGMEHLQSFSGGTEVTAFNFRAIEALKRVGFKVENPGGDNPHYKIYYDKEIKPVECYSKKFDDPANPTKDFAAIMTCSEANQNCPFVPGASYRKAIPYRDPKEADGTKKEQQVYDERCHQIAAELYYMLSRV